MAGLECSLALNGKAHKDCSGLITSVLLSSHTDNADSSKELSNNQATNWVD
jgi:hypothetical protein